MNCYNCKRPNGPRARELRPRGPGGALICYGCMNADTSKREEARKQYGAQLDAAGDVAVLDGGAPRKATVTERRSLIRAVPPKAKP